jgi:hydroxyacylglutathione hydrolase
MFLERVRSEGLEHWSYVVGDQDRAFVVDPRRDCRVYLDVAYRHGAVITHVFETHTYEDLLLGSTELAALTGASILRGRRSISAHAYGEAAREGDTFGVGGLKVRVLETPGHTYDGLCLVLSQGGDDPVAVFTGDTLLVGGVGRTDLMPGQEEEVAGLLHDSLHGKLFTLGDHLAVYPAHGAGAIVGARLVDRDFTTLGFERRHNRLAALTDRGEFVRRVAAERQPRPPYFREMERLNRKGPPALSIPRVPRPLSADQLADAIGQGALVVDTRSPEAFAGACIPDAVAIPLDMLAAYAGWFLPYDRPIALVVEHYDDAERAVRRLARVGYDDVAGFLHGGMRAWEASGRRYECIPAIYAGDLERRLQTGPDFTLLDVRTREEFEAGHLPEAKHVFLGELPDRLDEIPRDQPVVTFCGSGRRAITAASILKRFGYPDVSDCFGSMAACAAIACQIVAG